MLERGGEPGEGAEGAFRCRERRRAAANEIEAGRAHMKKEKFE